MRKIVITNILLLAVAPVLMAHPHFQKTTSATLPGDVKVTLSFFTVPSNMTHAENAENGAFLTPGFAALEISSAVTAAGVSIPAGTYTVGAVKGGSGWTMALHPGKLGFQDTPDTSKLINLDSIYEKSSDETSHLVVDVNPGHGKQEGKAVIVLGFGNLWLNGAIADAAE
jgi:hypothetical protein